MWQALVVISLTCTWQLLSGNGPIDDLPVEHGAFFHSYFESAKVKDVFLRGGELSTW